MSLEGVSSSNKGNVNEKGTNILHLLKQNLKAEKEPLCDENVLTAVEELSHLFSSNSEKLTTQLCKLFEACLRTLFLSSATQRLDEIFGRLDAFVVLESFLSYGPPLLSLEVLLDSLKQGKVSVPMFFKCIRRSVSKAGLLELLDSIYSGEKWTTRDISLLVSLPDRIFNYIKKGNISFDSEEYYRNLFDAILNMLVLRLREPSSSLSGNNDIIFSTLFSRICAIGQFKNFFHCCISFHRSRNISNLTHVTYLLASVSPAFMEKMLSDVIATIESNEENLSFVKFCLVDTSKRNAFARKCLMFFIPRRQLISKLGVSILREIFLHVCDESERQPILDQYLSLWSSSELIASQSISYQFQITRILLCFLAEVDLEYLHSNKVLQTVTNGVQCRLGNTDADIRYMGWSIGREFGRLFGVDNSILTEVVEDFQPSEDLESLFCSQSDRNFAFEVGSKSSDPKSTDIACSDNKTISGIPETHSHENVEASPELKNVQEIDNPKFLEPYEVSDEESQIESDEEEANLSKRKELAPSSISELITLFRKFRRQETEESWSLSLFVEGLEQLQSMIRRRSRAIKGAVSELVMVVFLLDPNAVSTCKESSKFAELRQSTLLLLAELSPLNFFKSLISKIYQSENALLTDKCRVLTLLVDACQQLSGCCPQFIENSPTEKSLEIFSKDTENQEQHVGKVLKMLQFSLRNLKVQNAHRIENRFAPISIEVFFLIWNEVAKLTRKNEGFPEIRQVLLAQSISTLSVFIFCAGKACPCYGEMLQALTQTAFIHLQHSNSNLRRSALVALVVSLQIANTREAKEIEQQYRATFFRSLVDYWMESSRQDPDNSCKQLAFRCLELWCQKVPEEDYILHL